MNKTEIPLLHTKLYPPPLLADHVHRSELLERLRKNSHRPLILVSAPAGYGKSTLVSCWLEECERPSAWLSLDENDNNLFQFLSYFVAALETIFPEGIGDTMALINAPSLPPIPVLATTLVNELGRMARDFVVVLDDIHCIRDKSVHEFLDFVLRHPLKPMQLVLVGRRDPILPIASLRARGLLTELRMRDLRFSADETAEFFQMAAGWKIEKSTAVSLAETTEGWVTGLRLAVLAMHGQDASDRKLLALRGTTRYVVEYLISEVLDRQSTDIRHFLLNTAILDRFCAPLCDALLEVEQMCIKTEIAGRVFIEWLQQNNLFVISLDAENRWFRYHHLFQDILQDELKRRCGSEEIATRHSRVSIWFETEGLIDEALKHALAAHDVDSAVTLVERNRQTAFNNDQWYVFERWLSILPNTVVQSRAKLLLGRAWVAYFHSRFEEIPLIIDQVEPLLNDDVKQASLYGEVAFFRGCTHFFQNDGARSLRYLEDAMKRIPVSYPMFRSEIEVLSGLATQMAAGIEQSTRKLADLLNAYPPPHDLRKTRLLITLVFIHIISGDLAEAKAYNRMLHEISASAHYTLAEAWSDYLQGFIHLCRCELDAAIRYLGRAAEHRFIFDTRAAVDALAGLMFAYQLQRRPEEAHMALQRLIEYTTSLNDPACPALANTSGIRLTIMQGQMGSAITWVEATAPPPAEVMLFWFEIPCISHCRALIAQGSAVNLRKAEDRLQAYVELNESHHNTFQLIGILCLQAVVFEKRRKPAEACATLERAVTLSRTGGFIFPFLELGPQMADLLNKLIKKNFEVDFIQKLLAAFHHVGQSSPKTPSHKDSSPPSTTQPLIEPLSHRELDVLELLSKRLQNKEIAEKLYISPLTVKSHLKNIYQKLSVENRRQAVERAGELGILTK